MNGFFARQPGQGDLRRGRVLLLGIALEKIDDRPISDEGVRLKSRKLATEVGLRIEPGVAIHFASEISQSKRSPRHEADTEFLTGS